MVNTSIDTDALDRAEDMLEQESYLVARAIADEALKTLPPLEDLSALSRAALLKGKSLLGPLVDQLLDEKADNPGRELFNPPWDAFQLAVRLDPDNEEALWQLDNMKGVMEDAPLSTAPEQLNHSEPLDVIVVGAGAAGVGVSLMLTRIFEMDPKRVLLVERGEGVGETFKKWPKEMRFISPSFNQQGWTNSFDLNSIAFGTSPAFTIHSEHPTGEQYAEYLESVAAAADLCVRPKTEVLAVRPFEDGNGFEVDVAPAGKALALPETLRARYVIWAAGEFQYPRVASLFPGSEHCIHNSSVRSWAEVPGDDFVVIGGFESGIDAASNLSLCGKNCTVVSSTAYWKVTTEDPSTELSPYTAGRLRAARASAHPPQLLAPFRVFEVTADVNGGYIVKAKQGEKVEHEGGSHRVLVPEIDATRVTKFDTDSEGIVTIRTKYPPILCAGFEGSVKLGVAKDLFNWVEIKEDDEEKEGESDDEENSDKMEEVEVNDDENIENMEEDEKDGDDKDAKKGGCADASPLLNEFDESTSTPGLFLVGPAVRHVRFHDEFYTYFLIFRTKFCT